MRPSLSIIIPARDEQSRLERGLSNVLAHVEETSVDAEVIVVDDGSRDGTAALLEQLVARHDRVFGVRLERNRGKGAAVRAGMQAATGRYRLFTDVDQSTPLREWTRLRDALEDGHDIAIASREIAGAIRLRDRWHRRQMGNVFRLLRDVFVVSGFIDSQCGFKLFTAESAETVFSRAYVDRFCFDVELLTIAAHHDLRVIEIPVTWTDDNLTRVRLVRDSLSMLHDLWRIRRNRAAGRYD